MNKIFIVAFFAFLTLGQSFEPGRDFMVEFFKQSMKKDLQLHEKCLGPEFDQHVLQLWEYFNQGKIPFIFLELISIKQDFMKYCPIEDSIELGKIIQRKLQDGSLFDDLLGKQTKAIQHLIDFYHLRDFSGNAIGSTFGKIVSEFIKEKGFLQFSDTSIKGTLAVTAGINEVLFDLLKGFFDGLKRSKTKCQCFEDIMKLRPLFFQRVEECIKATKGGMNFYAALEKMISAVWKDLVAVKTPCRYNYLVIALEKTWSQIIDRLIVYSFKIFPEFLKMVEGFKLNNAEQVGKGLGEIVDIALDFYVF